MSQYLTLLRALVTYGLTHPDELRALWALIVEAYEAAQRLAAKIEQAFSTAIPREAGYAASDEEQNLEEQLAAFVGTPRGPFGNGKILRWLLTSEEGKVLVGLLLSKIPGLGS